MRKEVYLESHKVWNEYNPDDKILMQKGVGSGNYIDVIHHIDGNHSNNNIKNLKKTIKGKHSIIHRIGTKHSKETKLKISKNRKGIATRTGIKHTEETKLKISSFFKGKKLKKEHKQKISKAHKGKVFTKEHKKNIAKAAENRKKPPPFTEEHKRRLSKARRKLQ